MVRSFILNESQREAIEDYLENRPNIMPSRIRQLRLKVKKLPYDEMASDLELLKRLRDLKMPKGRKGLNVAAGFEVQAETEGEVPAKFEAKKEAS